MLPNNETSKRDRSILEAVTKAAGWAQQLPKGVFRGVAETLKATAAGPLVCAKRPSMPKTK
jgi:hypothetical protein